MTDTARLAYAIEYELLTTGRKWKWKDGEYYPTKEDIEAVLTEMKNRLDGEPGEQQMMEVGGIVLMKDADKYEVFVKLGDIT